eukprot:6973502-Karenia_brevis.AAC.1
MGEKGGGGEINLSGSCWLLVAILSTVCFHATLSDELTALLRFRRDQTSSPCHLQAADPFRDSEIDLPRKD